MHHIRRKNACTPMPKPMFPTFHNVNAPNAMQFQAKKKKRKENKRKKATS